MLSLMPLRPSIAYRPFKRPSRESSPSSPEPEPLLDSRSLSSDLRPLSLASLYPLGEPGYGGGGRCRNLLWPLCARNQNGARGAARSTIGFGNLRMGCSVERSASVEAWRVFYLVMVISLGLVGCSLTADGCLHRFRGGGGLAGGRLPLQGTRCFLRWPCWLLCVSRLCHLVFFSCRARGGDLHLSLRPSTLAM